MTQVCVAENQAGNQTRPARLMAGADPCPVIPVEVLVEEEMVAPAGVGLKLLGSAKNGTPAVLIPQKDTGEPQSDVLNDLEQGHLPPRAGRALHPERISQVRVKLEQAPKNQEV